MCIYQIYQLFAEESEVLRYIRQEFRGMLCRNLLCAF